MGRTVLYTDGRREQPALVVRDRGRGVLDLVVCQVSEGLIPHVSWIHQGNVVQTGVPMDEDGQPSYLHPRTWRPVP